MCVLSRSVFRTGLDGRRRSEHAGEMALLSGAKASLIVVSEIGDPKCQAHFRPIPWRGIRRAYRSEGMGRFRFVPISAFFHRTSRSLGRSAEWSDAAPIRRSPTFSKVAELKQRDSVVPGVIEVFWRGADARPLSECVGASQFSYISGGSGRFFIHLLFHAPTTSLLSRRRTFGVEL